MKIQTISPQLQQNKKSRNSENIKFAGGFDAFTLALRFLETNQAWGANAVDLCSMAIPRTAVDFINRGPDAGTETMRREASGTVNHSMVGVYGSLAGLLLASSINNKFGIKAQKIFADNETLEFITKSFDANKGENYVKHFENLFGKMETLVDGEWKSIPKEDISDVVEKFNSTLKAEKAPDIISKDLINYSKAKFLHATGSENTYRFIGGKSTFTLSNGLENIYNVTKAVINKDLKGISTDEFLRSMKKVGLHRSLLGIGIASAIGMSIQPLNIYLTKKKTGSDGFVGVEGRTKDTSGGFFGLKALTSGLFGASVLASIGLKGGTQEFLKKLQFKGFTPNLNQLKLVYGLTIISRFMAARDKDELREAAVKDTLGFFNWLVLGNFVAKATANLMDKELLNHSEAEHGKGIFNRIIKSPLVTRDEVLSKALKTAGIDIIENGKALNFKQMLKKLADPKISEALRNSTNKKLRVLSIAQVVGYLYSGIILGFGIPKLNIYMTNKSEAKRKAKLAEQKQIKPQTAYNTMLQPENLAFLSKNM